MSCDFAREILHVAPPVCICFHNSNQMEEEPATGSMAVEAPVTASTGIEEVTTRTRICYESMADAVDGEGTRIVDYMLSDCKVAFNFVDDQINVFPLTELDDPSCKPLNQSFFISSALAQSVVDLIKLQKQVNTVREQVHTGLKSWMDKYTPPNDPLLKSKSVHSSPFV
jgi:hypothetical protein